MNVPWVEIQWFFLALLWNVLLWEFIYVCHRVCGRICLILSLWSNTILLLWSSAKCQPFHNNIYNVFLSEMCFIWFMLMVCGGSDCGQLFDESGWDISNEWIHPVLVGEISCPERVVNSYSHGVSYSFYFYTWDHLLLSPCIVFCCISLQKYVFVQSIMIIFCLLGVLD